MSDFSGVESGVSVEEMDHMNDLKFDLPATLATALSVVVLGAVLSTPSGEATTTSMTDFAAAAQEGDLQCYHNLDQPYIFDVRTGAPMDLAAGMSLRTYTPENSNGTDQVCLLSDEGEPHLSAMIPVIE